MSGVASSRRWLPARALGLAVSLTLLAAAGGAGPAAAQDGGHPPTPGAVQAVITDIGPALTRDPASLLRLRATIVNNTPEPVTRVRWRLRVGAPVTTRAGLTTPFADRGTSDVIWHDDLQFVEELAAGASHDVALYLPLDLLEDFDPPSGPAVFPLRFEVTHRKSDTIATADTYMIWSPDPQPSLRLGWVVAITDPPARDASFSVRRAQLAASVAPGGRLDGVLTALDLGEARAGAKLPLTLAINAEVVESVSALAATDPAAAAWLARLRKRASMHPVIALPYADADLVALVRAGLGAEVTASLRRGRQGPPGLDALLGITSLSDVAWPVGEVADAATTNILADNGIAAVLLDRMSLPRIGERAYTTTAAAELKTSARQLTAVVPDAPVTSLAADMAAGGSLFAVAQQRLLAETAVIAQQRPYDARDVFVRFPRDWAPADLDATAALLALPSTTPWLTGTTLPESVARPARADDRVAIPRYPEAARRLELRGDTLRAGQALRAGLASYQTILADSEPPLPGTSSADRTNAQAAAQAIRDTLIRSGDVLDWSESAHWQGRPAAAESLRSSVAATLTGLRGQVAVGVNTIRLTSTSGPVPITVVNHLFTPVRVHLTLRSQKFGLTFGRVPDVVVPAARTGQPGITSVQVQFEAQTVGKFPVDAQVLTADNVELGPPSRITVSTTAYGRVAILVTGGAFLLLVLASLLRFVFRRRKGRAAPPSDEDPDGPGGDEGPDPAGGYADLVGAADQPESAAQPTSADQPTAADQPEPVATVGA